MSRPNILLITTDQQRFDTIHALGNTSIYTPHLNWLVDEGIAFTRCYSDCPVCMPARATIMTGKCGSSLGLVGNGCERLPLAENPTLPGLLTQAGYQTRAQGKMHFHPIRANYGFEHMELPMDYYRDRHRHPDAGLPKQHGIGENEIEPVISTVDEAHSLTHWTVERSIDFLETRDDTRPFFMWTSFTKPHPPWDPCASYWALYRDRPVPPPLHGDWSPSIAEMDQAWLEHTYMLNNSWRMSESQLLDCKRAYYACITQIDYNLGLLFARLREMGLLETTWILFTSDHGDMLGDHHIAAKSVFQEGSAHVPLLIRPPAGAWDPKELAGTRCDDPVTLADVMTTILAIAGVDAPDDAEGADLRELVNSPQGRTLFGNTCEMFFMVLQGRYKYLYATNGGAELLFDLEQDPYEQHDLIRAGQAADTHRHLRQTLVEWLTGHESPAVENGELVVKPAPEPAKIPRWPGFHSTVVPTDVLH